MSFDALTKVSRLVNGQRYTSTDLGASQEAYASSIQMASTELWAQADLIPSASLPYSSSAAVNSSTTSSILKYWYKYPLTVANNTATGSSVWYFIYPSGSNSGVGSQLIQTGQLTNFISPKYGIPGISGNDADASSNGIIPGYNVAVFTSPDNSTFTPVNPNSFPYQFDYKTGTLQFTTTTIPSNRVYVTLYQYNGKFLSDAFNNLTASYAGTASVLLGSVTSASYSLSSSNALTASVLLGSVTSASYALSSSISTTASFSISASIAITASYAIYSTSTISVINNDTSSLISIPNSIYNSMFVNYVLNDTQNFRAGNIVVLYTTSSAVLSETSTTDIGNSSGLQFLASISASFVQLLAQNTSGNTYSIKYHYEVL